ncbi:MAG TPA: ATP phosphoribosyltransferase regulatory subunit, partial [Alphaproteobacteria bacterium]|nr:ATP phosphoribosyltransferase regulatory subunit [Alphaproteobacteria bacterium]
MNESVVKGLLPVGLEDLLAPEAEREADAVSRLMACFAGHGYQRVKPPLVEFEENLLQGSGQALSKEIFRLMDPLSQRMMAVRADMTMQIARIAQTRLAHDPRPLRLSYAGEVLRVKGGELEPARLLMQVGVELIGSAAAAGDAEVILLALEGLEMLAIDRLSIDLNAPTLVPAVAAGLELEEGLVRRARAALDRKDAAAVATLDGAAGRLFGALLDASGMA